MNTIAYARESLTRAQARVFKAIRELSTAEYSPSYKQIAAYCRLRSIGTIGEHVLALEAKGYVCRDRNRQHGLRILGTDRENWRFVIERRLQIVPPMENHSTWSVCGAGRQWHNTNLFVALLCAQRYYEDAERARMA